MNIKKDYCISYVEENSSKYCYWTTSANSAVHAIILFLEFYNCNINQFDFIAIYEMVEEVNWK